MTDATKVREALEPFAKLADMAHEDHRDSRPFIFAFDTAVAQRLTVGDLRRAREALAALPQGAVEPPDENAYCNLCESSNGHSFSCVLIQRDAIDATQSPTLDPMTVEALNIGRREIERQLHKCRRTWHAKFFEEAIAVIDRALLSPSTSEAKEARTCATCHAVLADGPQPAATYEIYALSHAPLSSMSDV